MPNQITYWLNWEQKLIKSNTQGLNDIPWAEVENYPLTIYCSAQDWPYLRREIPEQALIIDEQKRTYQIGKATIKELRGGSEESPESLGTQALKKCWELCPEFVKEHPSHEQELFVSFTGWVFPPRFENLQKGTFNNVYQIDIKSCHASIMRDYPLPFAEPQHLKEQQLIKEAIKQGKQGFIRFYLKKGATIKNDQIPFIPDYQHEIKPTITGRLLLHTRLFKTFTKQYQANNDFYYTDFWIFPEKKGCINPFLDYCQQLTDQGQTHGKKLANAFYGAVGKSKFGGYNYRAWTLAINHLAILQTYYLYRQFAKAQVLAIRSDCIYVKGDLPEKLLSEQNKYHLSKYQQVSFFGTDNVFIHDTQQLKSFVNGEEREELINKFIK